MKPTIAAIIQITDGKASQDGASVVVGYGSLGFFRLTPSTVILDGTEIPAVELSGKLARRNAGHREELADKIRAAGIYI